MEKKRILLVEDNVDNFELVRFLLDRAGCEVIPGHTGREAIQLASQHKPDMILLDLSIPEIDGWEAAREIKANPETSSIPLFALTAHTLPGDRQRAKEAGFDGFISKPIDVAGFGESINKALKTKS
ncbi:MAG TPA: response regulator [Anaerolineales bacterium]|nr:response regulator [Anaerolineales bacterium]